MQHRRLISARVIAMIVATLFLIPATTVMSASAAPSSLASDKAGSNYQYIAETSKPSSRQGLVAAGGINWQCLGSRCTVSGNWPSPGVAACSALAVQVGKIKSYGRAGAQLNSAQLSQCNVQSASTSTTLNPAPTASGLLPDKSADNTRTPMVMPNNITGKNIAALPAPNQLPGSGADNAPAGIPQAPPRGASDQAAEIGYTLRTRPLIDRIRGDESEAQCAVQSYVVQGRRFGEGAGTRNLMLLDPRNNAPIRVLRIYSWHDTSITADVPETAYGHPGQTYKVGIMDQNRQLLGNTAELKLCRSSFTLRGNINLQNCNARTADVSVDVLRDGIFVTNAPARVSEGRDFVLAYDVKIAASHSPRIVLRPKLREGVCNGGAWGPESVAHNMSYTHAGVTQDFTYSIAMQEVRIDSGIVASLLTDKFRGLRIHLNSHAPNFTRPNSRYLANDAYVDLPGALGGGRIPIEIKEIVSGAFRYYVNNLNLDALSIQAQGERFLMRLTFESDGNEIKGYCWDGVCLPLGDDGAPDGNIDKLIVDVYFKPIRYNIGRGTGGDISIGDVEVKIDAKLSGNGIAAPVIAVIENKIKSEVFPKLEKIMRDTIQQRTLLNDIAQAIRSTLNSRAAELFIGHVDDVMEVRMDGRNIIVRFLPR